MSSPMVPLAAVVAVVTIAGAVLRARSSAGARPLVMTPRVAAVALVAQAGVQRWLASSPGLAMPVRAAAFSALAVLALTLLASLSIITLQFRRLWMIAGLAAWTVGWIASSADLGALLVWSLGAPYPLGLHQLRVLDAELVQILATLGGLAIGAGLVAAIREARFRHSAMILLAGFAVLGLIVAVGEHRIELGADLPSIVPLRKDRDLAAAIRDLALAGVLWMYWRRVIAPRA